MSRIWGLPKQLFTVGKSIHFYEGNPINIHYLLLECFGRAQHVVVFIGRSVSGG